MSAAIEGGRRNMLLAGASFAWLTLIKFVPGKSARWYSITTDKQRHPEWFREDLTRLITMLQEKSIGPIVFARLPLHEAPCAHKMLEQAAITGKIVLMCQE